MENTTAVIFSSGLRMAMKENGLTQADLADRIGVTQAAVSKWLKGTVPKGDQLLSISRTLRIPMEWLLTGRGPRTNGQALWLKSALGLALALESLDPNASDEDLSRMERFYDLSLDLIEDTGRNWPPDIKGGNAGSLKTYWREFAVAFLAGNKAGKLNMLGDDGLLVDSFPGVMKRFEDLLRRGLDSDC